MNTYSHDDDGDIVMLNEHHDIESFLLSVAEADGDTSMADVDELDTSMATSTVSSEGGDADTLMPDVDEASMMSVESLATDDLVAPTSPMSICILPSTDDMSMATSSVSSEGGDVLMLDVDEEASMMSVESLATDDLVAPTSPMSICIRPSTDDMSMATSSVSSEGGDVLMLDVDEEASMMS